MMLGIKKNRYSFAGLCCLLIILLLCGCDASSDTRQYYQATGSWEGTIGADKVRGIIAPDGSYQFVIIIEGSSVGEYAGAISIMDSENIGRMTLQRFYPPENAGAPQSIIFKLSANQFKSEQGIDLLRTDDANGPANQKEVSGRWSFSSAADITNIVVDDQGNLTGGNGDNCQYSGTLKLLDPAWNIYAVSNASDAGPGLKISTVPSKETCQTAGIYSGVAMVLSESGGRRLWFAANNRVVGGMKPLLGEWAETKNVAPFAAMSILGERQDQSVLVQQISPIVELSAQASYDDNHDIVTYSWSGTDPDGNPLLIAIADGVGGRATFVPNINLDPKRELWYSIILRVDDGIAFTTVTRQIRVEWAPARYISCDNGTDFGNGTVLDTKTNLLWLKDAGCPELNLEEKVNDLYETYLQWGVSVFTAKDRADKLLKDGVCRLSDGSVLGDWRLPTVSEFEQIIYPSKFAAPPALLNGVGDSQWIEGDAFVNVGTSPINVGTIDNPSYKRYLYWTADPLNNDPLTLNWYVADFDYRPGELTFAYYMNNPSSVWPVRELRTNLEHPELNEQCMPKQQP